MSWVVQERQSLVETFRAADPRAPTLCEGWDVRRLLAHLVVRERRPLTLVGDLISREPPGREPGLSRLVDQAGTPEGYGALVDAFAQGAPRWSPMSWAGERLNLLEYHVHHEDVRRAGSPYELRDLSVSQQDAIWHQLAPVATLGVRQAPVGVRMQTPRGQCRVLKKGTGVTLTGEALELVLWTMGRRASARIEVTGPVEALTEFRAWSDTR